MREKEKCHPTQEIKSKKEKLSVLVDPKMIRNNMNIIFELKCLGGGGKGEGGCDY